MIEVYSASWCGHCKRLKDFLRNSNLEFIETDIDEEVDKAMLLVDKGLKTIPQVFLDGKHLGGCEATIKYLTKE